MINSFFEFFTKPTFWVGTISYNFGLVLSGKKTFICSRHYKTFSFCFYTCTTYPLMGVPLIFVSFLTSQWALSMQRLVFPVLLDLLKSLCFGCFLSISYLLRRGVYVIFFILVYVYFLFILVTLFTYRVSFFCFAMAEIEL